MAKKNTIVGLAVEGHSVNTVRERVTVETVVDPRYAPTDE